jgi:two-component system OmpR family response regulator
LPRLSGPCQIPPARSEIPLQSRCGSESRSRALRILLVEDDPLIGGAVRDHAAADGHAVDWARTLADADAFREVAAYDLILLDLRLPDGDGNGLLKAVRAARDVTPVIILTARDQISDRIAGLNNGADDYLVKPFDLGELSARIHAVARRAQQRATPEIVVGDLRVETATRQVSVGGAPVDLTAREWAVLERLVGRPGAIVSKARIEEALYAFGAEVESNTVEVYVSRLRKKIGQDRVVTVRGLGYRLGPGQDA